MGKGSCSILTEHKTQCMLLMDLQICYLHGFKCAQGFFIHTNFSSHRLILGSTLSQLMFTFSIPKMHILSCSPQTGKDIADISRVSWWKTLSVLRNCNGAWAWNDQFVSVPAATDQLPDWPKTFLMVRYSALPAIEDSTNWPMVNDHRVVANGKTCKLSCTKFLLFCLWILPLFW